MVGGKEQGDVTKTISRKKRGWNKPARNIDVHFRIPASSG